MHISHDFTAKNTCPSYEFLVVFGQVWVWDRKSAGQGGRELGWPAGRSRLEVHGCGVGVGKISQIHAGAGWDGFEVCRVGADKKFQPA